MLTKLDLSRVGQCRQSKFIWGILPGRFSYIQIKGYSQLGEGRLTLMESGGPLIDSVKRASPKKGNGPGRGTVQKFTYSSSPRRAHLSLNSPAADSVRCLRHY